MSGFIYVWYDTHHKMFYIGSHWGAENDGYICSSNWMKRAYGRRPQHFTYLSGKPRRKILARVTKREDLLKTEQYFLNMIEEGEFGIRYYNLCSSSTGHWLGTEQSRLTVGEKISKAKIGKKTGPFSEERKLAISAAKKASFARRRAETGESYSPETRKAWDGVNVGKIQSEESNIKRSESLKLAYAEGRKKPNIRPKTNEEKTHLSKTMKDRLGKPQSEETKIKLSKEWIVTSPSGEELFVRNLKKFCQENSLQNTNIYKKSGSRGWHARLA